MDVRAVTVTALCEIGPVAVRVSDWHTGELTAVADPALAEAVLAFDEPVALFDGRAIAAEQLWRRVLHPLLAGVDACVLVHPSWWPPSRMSTITACAEKLVGRVDVVSRAALLARRFPDAVVIEIGPHLVLLTAGGTEVTGVETRGAAPDVVADSVARLARRCGSAPSICVDTPPEVPGGTALADLITARLRGAELSVRRVEHREFVCAPEESTPRLASAGARSRRGAVAVAAVVAAVVLAVWATVPEAAGPRSDVATTNLVEGRVTTQVPADWAVRHVTGGPGSARVEVVAQQESARLHLTQARVPNGDLAATAVTLRAALDAQPPGIFVDFNPSDLRAGRPAVTYREIRAGHDIRWSVLVDGGVRIGVGCQNAPGKQADIDTACERAVRTARQIG